MDRSTNNVTLTPETPVHFRFFCQQSTFFPFKNDYYFSLTLTTDILIKTTNFPDLSHSLLLFFFFFLEPSVVVTTWSLKRWSHDQIWKGDSNAFVQRWCLSVDGLLISYSNRPRTPGWRLWPCTSRCLCYFWCPFSLLSSMDFFAVSHVKSCFPFSGSFTAALPVNHCISQWTVWFLWANRAVVAGEIE